MSTNDRVRAYFTSTEHRERVFALMLLLPCFSIIAVFAFYPIVYSIYLSLYRIILELPGLPQKFIYLDNYRQLWADPIARQALRNTLVFVAFSTAGEMILGLIIALAMNRSFCGQGYFRAAILIPWAVPTVVASQMWRFIDNDQYGLLNYVLFGNDVLLYKAWLANSFFAMGAIIVADIWKTSAFAALILLAGLQTIPDELYETARLDGASVWQRFTRITLPLLKPALLTALLFRTIDAFRVFDLVFVVTQGGPADSTNVLQFYGYKKMFAEGFLGYGAAISTVVFLLVLTASLIYVRFIGMRSLTEEKG